MADSQSLPYRVGLGTDRHRLAAGRPLILGGVAIPSEFGCVAHSDGDALLHAITDACLGAASLGDIGEHFPDTDPRFKGADSAELLRHALRLVREAGFELINVDTVIHLEQPKLLPHRLAMRTRIAAICGLPLECVGVKAKTGEKLGEVGRGEVVDTLAVALLRQLHPHQ